ncbi:hypothetical protein JM946_00015 [Steroidobacter sp. S1-65]|uniref:Response regulatory domain-containing protein n=1 Tax=Steroidobacter gossypii TaxID=2805490 RepID=A0ABS1WQ77_9GAMM|nr:hypothetical protein [Steroidobacter gossypii]MBM0103103.1 hypothetical protein [Steroidobacter gossypii]
MANPCALKLLIVEDEWLIASETALQIVDAGWQVVGPSATVAIALKLIEVAAIDGAVLDIHLRDGERSLGIAAALRERDIPFLFASGHAAKEQRPGFEDVPVLAKPYSSSQLVAAVRRHIVALHPSTK